MERKENAPEPQNHLYMCTACTVVRMVHVFFSPAAFLYGSLEQFDSPESPNPFAVSDIDIVASLQIVEIGMLLQVGTEGLFGEGIQRIVGTPLLVHHIELLGTGFAVGLEPEVAF